MAIESFIDDYRKANWMMGSCDNNRQLITVFHIAQL